MEKLLRLSTRLAAATALATALALPAAAQVKLGGTPGTAPDPAAVLELESSNSGLLLPRLTLAQRNAITNPPAGLLIYQTDGDAGLQHYSGSWQRLMPQSNGDLKHSFLTTDHNGWVKLDGRLKSSLTAAQQAAATALGIGTNLPNATDAYLSQVSGSAVGNITGNTSNVVTLQRSDLPNTSITLSHNHSVSDPGHGHTTTAQELIASSGTGARGDAFSSNSGTFTYNRSTSSSSTGISIQTASPSFNLNNGVTQTAVSVKPKTVTATCFIYLGM